MSTVHQKEVNLCMTIKARDIGPFEDLANELGYEIHDINFVKNKQITEQEELPLDKPTICGFRRYTVTPEVVKKVKQAIAMNPRLPNSRIKELTGVKQSIQTISRIRHGHYNGMVEKH